MDKLYIYLPIIFLFLLLFVFQNPTIVKTTVVYLIIFILSSLSGFLTVKGYFKKGWPFLVEIIVLTVSALLFFLFLSNRFWQYVFIIVFCFFSGLFLKCAYSFLHQIRVYEPHSLEKVTGLINFMISYWVLSGVGTLMDWDPFRLFSYLDFILVFVLFFWLIYSSGQSGSEQRDFKKVITISLVLSEIYLVIRFLPFGFHLNALIVSIIYGIIINLWQKNNRLRQSVPK